MTDTRHKCILLTVQKLLLKGRVDYTNASEVTFPDTETQARYANALPVYQSNYVVKQILKRDDWAHWR